jgi:hypothetical protein
MTKFFPFNNQVRLTALILAFTITGCSPKETTKVEITFKGIHFDKPEEMEKIIRLCLAESEYKYIAGRRFQNRFPITCIPEPNPNDHGLIQVSFEASFGSLKQSVIRFTKGKQNSLIGVSIFGSVEEISTLVPALLDKYGPPTLSPIIIELNNGNRVTRELMKWTDVRGTVMTLNTAAASTSAKADLRVGTLTIESVQLRSIKGSKSDEIKDAIKENL